MIPKHHRRNVARIYLTCKSSKILVVIYYKRYKYDIARIKCTCYIFNRRRDAILDKIRQLETSSDSEFEEDEDFVSLVKENKLQKISEETNENEGMDTTGAPRENRPARRRYKKPNKVCLILKCISIYHNYHFIGMITEIFSQKRNSPCRVMLSEWLVDKPTDFYENWMGVFCPVGKRCLVVASRGKTCVFSRTHEYMGVFQSHLPGGSKLNSKDREYLMSFK